MNHRSSGSLILSKAIQGFINYKTAEGLSPRTIYSHEHLLMKWMEHIGDREIGRITSQDIVQYLNWLRNEYVPVRFSGKTHPLSPKTLRNVWVTISSFYTWAARELHLPNVIKDVPSPRAKAVPIEPFSQDEVQRMLKACSYSREAHPSNRRSFVMRMPNALRDQAVILTLVDTGLRAMELCKLLVANVDQKTGRVKIKHGVIDGAKGGKGRTVYLGKTARRALWRYLVSREDGDDLDAPVFVAQNGHPLTPTLYGI